jgi:hypothetical protein
VMVTTRATAKETAVVKCTEKPAGVLNCVMCLVFLFPLSPPVSSVPGVCCVCVGSYFPCCSLFVVLDPVLEMFCRTQRSDLPAVHVALSSTTANPSDALITAAASRALRAKAQLGSARLRDARCLAISASAGPHSATRV